MCPILNRHRSPIAPSLCLPPPGRRASTRRPEWADCAVGSSWSGEVAYEAAQRCQRKMIATAGYVKGFG